MFFKNLPNSFSKTLGRFKKSTPMFSDCIVMLQKKHHDATQKNIA